MIIDDLVDPAELTGFVREIPYPANFTLNAFLPDRTFDDIEAVINQVTRTNRAAKFRAYDAETPIGKRDAFTQRRVLLPPLGQKTVITEYERLQLERLRGANEDRIVNAVYDDAEINTRATQARMELARGDVLVDGKFTLAGENGLTLEADYGLAVGQLVTPAGAVWSNHATATVLSDLRTWADAYTDTAGEPPAALVTSRTVVSHALQNAEIRALVGSLNGTPNIVTRGQLNAALEAHGLPPFIEYSTKVDVDGVTTAVLPADRVIFLPADPTSLGYTAWGITAEALELIGRDDFDFNVEDAPGLVSCVIKEGDPIRTWTKVAGTGMPVIVDATKLMVADVF